MITDSRVTEPIGVPSDELGPADVQIREAEKGIGIVIQTSESAGLIAGVQIAPVALWPDDRGHFLEVLRVGSGLPALFPPATRRCRLPSPIPVSSRHSTTTCVNTTAGLSSAGCSRLR